MSKPLVVSLSGRVLTVTGRFDLRELNGKQRWALSIVGVTHDPSIALDILQCVPDWDNRIGIANFSFITLEDAVSAHDQLVDAGYAISASTKPALQTGGKVDPIDWGALTDAINNAPPRALELYELAYQEGRAKYGKGFPTPESKLGRAQAAHRDHSRPAGKCDECGGSGFYEGFNVKREPCSQGCKPR